MADHVTWQELKQIEAFANHLMNKFGVDIDFTKHFADRVNDERNKPSIDKGELLSFFQKLANSGIKPVKTAYKQGEREAVLVDLQRHLNLPAAFSVTPSGHMEITMKTIMRKPNFKTPDKKIPLSEEVVEEARGSVNLFMSHIDELPGFSFITTRGSCYMIVYQDTDANAEYTKYTIYTPKKKVFDLIHNDDAFYSSIPEFKDSPADKDRFRVHLINVAAFGNVTETYIGTKKYLAGINYFAGKAFNKTQVTGFSNFYHTLTAKYNLKEYQFEHLFGALPDIKKTAEAGDFKGIEKVGRFTVQFGKVSKDQQVNIRGVLTRAEQVLDRYGLGELTNVHVRIKPLTSSIVGLYYHGTNMDVVEISPKARLTRAVVNTVIHELGHRFYYRTPGVREEAEAKYNEITGRTSNYRKRPTEDKVVFDDFIPLITLMGHDLVRWLKVINQKNDLDSGEDVGLEARKAFLENGTYLIYRGRSSAKTGMKNNAIVTCRPIHGKGEDRTWLANFYNTKEDFLEGKLATARALNSAYLMHPNDDHFDLHPSPELRKKFLEKIDTPHFREPIFSLQIHDMASKLGVMHRDEGKPHYFGNKEVYRKDWHVTTYAKTNLEEWFAELFIYYLMGQLAAGEPKDWMKSIIAKYRTKIT